MTAKTARSTKTKDAQPAPASAKGGKPQKAGAKTSSSKASAKASPSKTSPRKAQSKSPKAPETAKEILRRAKPTRMEAHVDAPTPLKGQTKAKAKGGSGSRKPTPGSVAFRRDSPLPLEQNAAKLLRQLRDEDREFHPSEGKGTFDGSKFDEFFEAEIETEVTRPAEIVHDRIARWRCQCCDAVIPVPRRTTVYHGDYILEHDDVLGLLVNGERWVPKAETPLEVVQPGRLRDPWTGEVIRGGKRSV